MLSIEFIDFHGLQVYRLDDSDNKCYVLSLTEDDEFIHVTPDLYHRIKSEVGEDSVVYEDWGAAEANANGFTLEGEPL